MLVDQVADFVVGGQTFVLDSLLGAQFTCRKDHGKRLEQIGIGCEIGS